MHLLAYFTSGVKGGPAQDVSATVDRNSIQSSPATPRKSTPALSVSGMDTPTRVPNAARLTRNTSKPGTPSTTSVTSARGAALDARACDGSAGNGALAMRTPDVPGKRATAESGRGVRSSGRKSRSHSKRRKRRTVSTLGLPGLTGRLDNEEQREQQRVAREDNGCAAGARDSGKW